MARMLERDWQFVRVGAADLESYILSPELYWPLPGLGGGRGSEPVLQFTLGNLNLSRARLEAVPWTPEERVELDELAAQIDAVRQRWKVNWARKAAREQAARLRLWQDYLLELLPEPSRRASGYAFEVRWRAILDLLNDDSGGLGEAERSAVSSLDSRLRAKSEPGPFVWEPEVQAGFPPEAFWYLYRAFPR